MRRSLFFALCGFLCAGWVGTDAVASETTDVGGWPEIRKESRPWAYWWWMGSAVDETNLTRELTRCHEAGLGGVHIIPIYGARGYEDRFIDYLSPKWMRMLSYTVREAQRLGMDVDMTTGSGWCFGGPHVTDEEANASVVHRVIEVTPGAKLNEKFDRKSIQAVVACAPDGRTVELTGSVQADGALDWTAPGPSWRVHVVSQKPSGQKVKRAGPGGQGHMLNLIYPAAMRHYLEWFETAFAGYNGPLPRAMYHDSYEYRSDWAPDFFGAFEKRRGYPLQKELPALFARSPRAGQEAIADDHVARVKSDYRETISDVMAEDSLPLWSEWSRRRGFITRNEAHGSPGNWLDLYAAADIPETEMFYKDRNKLVSKFASSAAHVSGRNLVAAETGTWLKEHFTETLADMKYLLDDLFLSGVNHVFYHGTCYSPDEAGWPGWHFYASYEMNPRNAIWRDVPALNTYASRCQAVLQSGKADNDILVYWPIYDVWHSSTGMVRSFTVHGRDWFEQQPIGKTAERLWNRGYAFDYVSDRQLTSATVEDGAIIMGGRYTTVVVPRTGHMPVATLRKLVELAQGGASIIFEDELPQDVPGWGRLEQRRAALKELLKGIKWQRLSLGGRAGDAVGQVERARVDRGLFLVGDLETALLTAGIRREPMFDHPGVMCVRRSVGREGYYFIANRSETLALTDWVPLGRPADTVLIMDPLTGRTGSGAVRKAAGGATEVFLSLAAGESIILRIAERGPGAIKSRWVFWEPAGAPLELRGTWKVTFLEGGPQLPSPFETRRLVSWTELGGPQAESYAGTARYSVTFDAPGGPAGRWRLDLGRVFQSARVRVNGEDLGSLFAPPFRTVLGSLKPKGNLLEVEVTNTSANRIRDLDRRGVKWKNFYDINFVNIDYKPFDASNWLVSDSGLLGPVTLTPVQARNVER